MKRLIAACALTLCVSGPSLADSYLQGIGGDHARSFSHDRFYAGADKAFIGDAFDWSGVGQASSGTWVTMISPTYFVSANHYHPGAGNTVTFYEANSLSGPSHTYTVDNWGFRTSYDGSGAPGLGSDLWLGKLTQPLAAADNIATYPVLDFPGDADYLGREIHAYGLPNRVGRNHIDSIEDNYEIDKTRVFYFGYNATGGTGEDEIYMMPGDSGGPTFGLWNGALALLGIHYTNDTGGAPPYDGARSGDSFVPFYVDQLDAHMGGESVTLVPEPAAGVLCMLAALLLGRKHGRQPI